MSFYFAIAYLIVEYMRPQSMYEALANLPFAEITIAGLIVFLFLEGRARFNSSFQNILISAYLFWFFVSYLFAVRSEFALQPLVDFSKWVVIYFMLTNTINDRKRLYIFLIAFLLLNFKYTQFAVRIWAQNGFYSDPRGLNAGGGIGSGFFNNPNDFGAAITSMAGLSFYMIRSDAKKLFNWFKMRWFHIALMITIPLAVLATSSRGAALALGVASLGIWYKGKRKFIGIAGLIIAAILFILLIPEDNWTRFQSINTEQDSTGQTRLELWRAGIRMANDYPLTGVGPDNYAYVNEYRYGADDAERTIAQHNVFIQAASELGYPGLILFVAMIIGCFYNQRKARQILKEKDIDDPFLYGLSHGLDICLIGFAVNGMFITVLYYPFFWMLLILSVSLFDVVRQLEQHAEQSAPADGLSQKPRLQIVPASRYAKNRL